MKPRKILPVFVILACLLLLYILHKNRELTQKNDLSRRMAKEKTVKTVKLSKKMQLKCRGLNKKILSKRILDKIIFETLTKQIQLMQICPWKQNAKLVAQYRSEFKQCCNASQDLVLTQENTVMGQKILYETNRKKSVIVKDMLFQMLPKEPLWSQTLGHCAVVGNGGILNNSRCGQQIDKADFVIRLNLPPLNNENDVGMKTSLVTANPTILRRFDFLSYTRKSFEKMMEVYGQSVVVMPAFSYASCTEPSFRAFFTLKDFNLQNVTFFHPEYLLRLNNYWKSKGLLAQRLSSGMMLVSVALELCSKVTLYGFWPFSSNLNRKPIFHHYYDNVGPKKGVHKMSEEFLLYMQMHSKGLLQLKIGMCS